MDFETLVLNELSGLKADIKQIDTKVDKVCQWQAGKDPVLDRHTQQIETMKRKLFGYNGDKGIERKLDTVIKNNGGMSWGDFGKRVLLAVVIAALIGIVTFGLQMYKHSDNLAPDTRTEGKP